jgi:adenosylhomocysteine nucleosidase
MLLIAAALAEELNIALDLCRTRAKVVHGSMRIWSGSFGGHTIYFLKTGVGPGRATKKLDSLLTSFHPHRILIIGYAGALAPELKLADLVVMRRASIFGEKEVKRRPLDQLEISASVELDGSSELFSYAQSAGLPAHCGDGLTSPLIIGAPEQKQILYQRFQALSIDMETAALARAAHAGGIAVSCVRVVSDEAADQFLAPFTYDPEASSIDRAFRVLGAGNWRNRLQAWRERSMKARESLRGFVRFCFEAWTKTSPENSWLEQACSRRD